MNWFKRVSGQREFMIGAIVFCVIVAMSFASPYFLSSGTSWPSSWASPSRPSSRSR